VMYRANQAMSTLERYRARFDEVIEVLATREFEDQVTLRDVALALQRAEMLRRIADRLEGYVVELGDEGRMIALQLEELFEQLLGGELGDLRDGLRGPAATGTSTGG